MRLVSLKIWRHKSQENAVELSDNTDLSFVSFFERSVAREQVRFHARTVVSRTDVGQRQSIQIENVGYCHAYVHPSGLAATVVTDKEYPLRVAYTLISEVVKEFLKLYPNREGERALQDTDMNFPLGKDLFGKFQDPQSADKIFKIERELDELKNVMLKNMDDLMARGETLRSLEDKSSDLSHMGKKFAREARKNNECCSAAGM